MYELPLFPLNTVLFPGAPLHLHIFEERYKRMIGMCIQNREPFGVVLIQRGAEALGPVAEPHPIGCTAQIIQAVRLEQERMNIVALGEERFRILSLDREAYPYLVGLVENYPLATDSPEALEAPARRLRLGVERFIETLVKAGGGEFDPKQLPDDPVMLGFMAAALLQIAPAEKQELLSLERAEPLLEQLLSLYRRETALLQTIVSEPGAGQIGSFSRN
jgi:Lon protease-like protein